MRKSWMIFISAGMLSLIFLTGCSDTKYWHRRKQHLFRAGIRFSSVGKGGGYGGKYTCRNTRNPNRFIGTRIGSAVTHSRFDHSQIDKVENRNKDCQIISYREAIRNGKHQVFDFGYVKVEAAECAELVGAKHNIPYHMTTITTGRQFD